MIFLYSYILIAIISLFVFTYLSFWKNDPFNMTQDNYLIFLLSVFWPISWILCIFWFGSFPCVPYLILKLILGEPNVNHK